MTLRNLLTADKYRVSRCSLRTARSAARVLRFHNTYATIDAADAKPVQYMYLRELRILIRRCLKLTFYLLTHQKKAAEKPLSW